MSTAEVRVRAFLSARGCGEHVIAGGLDGLLEAWERTAEQLEHGYPLTLDDYLNDLDGRQLIEHVVEAVPEALTPAARKRLAAADRRVRGSTRERKRCLWGEALAQSEGWEAEREWWYWAEPKSPGPDLKADLGG